VRQGDGGAIGERRAGRRQQTPMSLRKKEPKTWSGKANPSTQLNIPKVVASRWGDVSSDKSWD